MANYLYNGVQLPALPEWDKEAYPYAEMYAVSGALSAIMSVLKVTDRPADCYALGDNDYGSYEPSYHVGTNYISYKIDKTSDTWVVKASGQIEAATSGVNANWANYDLFYEDGTLYLAASEPIPVGATPDIDPTSMFMGWLTGRRIAGQRRKGVES